AERGSVYARGAKRCLRQSVEVRRRNLPSERSPLTEPRVVDQNGQDVRCAVGSPGQGHRSGFRVLVGLPDLRVGEELLGFGQDILAWRRTRLRRSLLLPLGTGGAQ